MGPSLEKVDRLPASGAWASRPEPVRGLIHPVKYLMTIYVSRLLVPRSIRPDPTLRIWSSPEGLRYRPEDPQKDAPLWGKCSLKPA